MSEPRYGGHRYSTTLNYRPWKPENRNSLVHAVSICRHKLRRTNCGDILGIDCWILKSLQQLPSKYVIRNHYLHVRHPIVIYEQHRVSTDRKSHTKQNKTKNIILYYIILYYIILYYIILYYIILYYDVMLWYVMFCYVMICYVMFCYVMMCCYIILYYIMMLCYGMLCFVMLGYVMICYVVILYYIILYKNQLSVTICTSALLLLITLLLDAVSIVRMKETRFIN